MTTAFKVGDKVTIHNSAHNGTKGTVTRLRISESWPFEVTYRNGIKGPFSADELKLVEESKPAFKTGDMVRYDSKGKCPEFDGLELKISSREFGSTEGTYAWVEKGNQYFPQGREVSVTTAYLSLINPALKEGDKVELLMDYMWAKKGDVFTVIDPDRYGSSVYAKHDVKGRELGGFKHRFKLVEVKPFTFADIQVGDKVRRTEKWDNTGSSRIIEGVVTDVAYNKAATAEGLLVGYIGDTGNPHMTLELLERPEPVKAPKPWEDAKTGDVLFRLYKDGHKDTFVKQGDGGWIIYYPAGGTFDVGPDEKVAGYFLGTECVAPQLA